MMHETPIDHIVKEVIFNYPTLAEAYKIAATDALQAITEQSSGKKDSAA